MDVINYLVFMLKILIKIKILRNVIVPIKYSPIQVLINVVITGIIKINVQLLQKLNVQDKIQNI